MIEYTPQRLFGFFTHDDERSILIKINTLGWFPPPESYANPAGLTVPAYRARHPRSCRRWTGSMIATVRGHMAVVVGVAAGEVKEPRRTIAW